MPPLRGDLARWVAVLKSSDVKEVLSRMSSYYVNLGLLAALLGGFSVSLLASPGVSAGGDEYYRLNIAGVSGSFAACTFLPCVIDCVLIDNTIKMLPITEPGGTGCETSCSSTNASFSERSAKDERSESRVRLRSNFAVRGIKTGGSRLAAGSDGTALSEKNGCVR